jgi:large subunit ribosomal protein L27
MAHKKAVGGTKLGRDSQSKRLGVKIFGGQPAISGNIVVRQRGTKYHAGNGVRVGKDHTVYAVRDGEVFFQKKKIKSFSGSLKTHTIVHVTKK